MVIKGDRTTSRLRASRATVWHSVLLVVTICSKPSCQGPNERRLLEYLFTKSGYNKLERPVVMESDALNVTFGLTLQQIIDVDEKNQIINTNMWLNMLWNDYNLAWNATEYGGVTSIRVPPAMIWKPDILMYNSADEAIDSTFPTNVVVSSNGDCLWIPPGLFLSTCKIDITWFPFDEQRCSMKFGSWTYDNSGVDLQLKNNTGDISSFIDNGEWLLIGMPAVRNNVSYDCCPEQYIDITFTIHIRRRTLFYGFNLIIPCVLISSMALLTFTLPPESGEKISLGVTILLSLTVFLLLVAEAMPPTSDAVPLIGMYFSCTMLMCSLSVVFTVLVLNCHHRSPETHVMPRWVQKIVCDWLARLVMMSRPRQRERQRTASSSREPEVNEDHSSPSNAATADGSKGKETYHLVDGGNQIPRDLFINGAPVVGVTVRPSTAAVPRCVDVDDVVIQSRGSNSSGGLQSPINGIKNPYRQNRDSLDGGPTPPSTTSAVRASVTVFDESTCVSRIATTTTNTDSSLHHPVWTHRSQQHVLFPSLSLPSSRPAALIYSVPMTLHQPSAYPASARYSVSPTARRRVIVAPASIQSTSPTSPASFRVTACEPTIDREMPTIPHHHHHHHHQHHDQPYYQNYCDRANLTCPPPSFQSVASAGAGLDLGDDLDTKDSFVNGSTATMTTTSGALTAILGELRLLTGKMREEDEYETQCEDWKFAAMVVDRVCLILFSVFTFVSTFAIIFSAPHVIA